MNDRVDFLRRGLLRSAVASTGIAGLNLAFGGKVAFAKGIGSPALALAHLKNVDAGVLNIAYYEAGPADGPAVVLLHRLAKAPVITVPTITFEGDANGAPHPEASAYARKFSGGYEHRVVNGGIGHNLPQEAPQAFAAAVAELARL